MKSEIKLSCILLLMGMSCPCWADFTVTKVGDSVVDPTALTAKRVHPYFGGVCLNAVHCQQDAVVTHENHQYVGYYDAERRLSLARRKLPAGQWDCIRFTDYGFTSNDDHCVIAIGVCPKDGTVHVSPGAHNGPLSYRVSRKGVATHPESVAWEAALFGPIVSELEQGKPPAGLCYPRFWQTPDGGLQFGYRSGAAGSGDYWLVDYDADTGTWMNSRQMVSRQGTYESRLHGKTHLDKSRSPYFNGYEYGPQGRLHATWVWAEHNGTWPELIAIAGCDFDADSEYMEVRFVVDPKAEGDPVVAGKRKEFNYTADWLSFDRPVTGLPGVEVLFRLDEKSYTPVRDHPSYVDKKPMGDDHPICWRRKMEKGRYFFTGLGHDIRSIDTDFARAHLIAAIQWTAGAAVEPAHKPER